MTSHAEPAEAAEPLCSFYTMDGFSDTAPVTMLSLDRDCALRAAHPELHARLTCRTDHYVGTTEDGRACTYADAVTLFEAGGTDGTDACVYRKNRLFRAGSTYFVLPGRRLSSFSVDREMVSSLSGDGKSLVTVEYKWDEHGDTRSSTVLVRNVDSGALLQKFEHEKPVTASSLSGDGKSLLTVETDYDEDTSVVTVRNVDTGAQLQKFEQENCVSDSCLSGDGKTLLVAKRKKIIVRSVATGATLQEFEHENRVSSAALSDDGKSLVTVETDYDKDASVVTVRNVDTGAQLQKFEHENRVSDSCLSGDATTLVTVDKLFVKDGHWAGLVLVRNVSTGVELQKFESEQAVTSSSLSGDGKTLVTVESKINEYGVPESSTVLVRDSGAQLRKFEHAKPVRSSSLSTDGKSLVTVEWSVSTDHNEHDNDTSVVTVRNVDTGAPPSKKRKKD
jgi:hypothetical protein